MAVSRSPLATRPHRFSRVQPIPPTATGRAHSARHRTVRAGLAMLAIAGMVAQELVTKKPLF